MAFTDIAYLFSVGFGDMVPETAMGRLLAVICCLYGVILLGLIFTVVESLLTLSPKAKRAVTTPPDLSPSILHAATKQTGG